MDTTLIIGYIGGFLLGISSLPEMWRTIKDKRCHIGWGMLLVWFFGEVFMEIYAIILNDWALIFNYTANLIVLIVLLWYKIRLPYRNLIVKDIIQVFKDIYMGFRYSAENQDKNQWGKF